MSALAPCTSCQRHVRRSEVACPFCGVALALQPAPSLRVVSERLGRAAIFAAAVGNVVGCSNSHTPDHDAGGVIAAYGAPALDDAAVLGDAGAPMTHYGAPPPPVQDAATVGDAGIDADLGCCNADYGAHRCHEGSRVMSLMPCPSCARHVRATETSCPFCAASIAVVPTAAPVLGERLGRAALFAFGAAMATNVAACSMSTTPGNDAASAGDAGTDAVVVNPDSGFFPPYGTPPVDTGPPDDGGNDAGFAGAYGAPPPHDAGH